MLKINLIIVRIIKKHRIFKELTAECIELSQFIPELLFYSVILYLKTICYNYEDTGNDS